MQHAAHALDQVHCPELVGAARHSLMLGAPLHGRCLEALARHTGQAFGDELAAVGGAASAIAAAAELGGNVGDFGSTNFADLVVEPLRRTLLQTQGIRTLFLTGHSSSP